MGTFSPGTDANGPSFRPRGGSDVRQTTYCLFGNVGWRCRFLELGYGRLPGNRPTPVYQDGQTPGSHHPGARACAPDFSAVRTFPTFAVIYRSLAAGARPTHRSRGSKHCPLSGRDVAVHSKWIVLYPQLAQP